jgi:hypothetical protein
MNFNDFMSLLNHEFNRVQSLINDNAFDGDTGQEIKDDLQRVLDTLGNVIDSIQSIQNVASLF